MRLIATSQGLASVPAASTATPAAPERRSWLKKLGAALGLGLLAGPAAAATQSTRGTLGVQGTDGDFVGEIILFAGNFVPAGYYPCNGQTIPINQNQALYALLGTNYGGNGTSTFGLPNLNGRVPVGSGVSPSGTSYTVGQTGGTESVTLTTSQMPAHNHALNVSSVAATMATPGGNFLAPSAGQTAGGENLQLNSFAATGGSAANLGTITSAGSNQPHSIMQPYLAITYCICANGIFPSRN